VRFSTISASLIVLVAAAYASDLKIKVIDPQDAAVSGAQVELLGGNSNVPIAIEITSAEGTAVFHDVEAGGCRVQVLAPGFAAQTVKVSSAQEEIFTIKLHLAQALETVAVTATRSPVPGEASGSDVDVLRGEQITLMNSVAANDALRYLPGAVVSTTGQRGGLASLFVRGGDSRYNKVIVDDVPITEPGGTFDFGVVPLAETDRMEFVRGAQSTLYGSDAVSSVVQIWTRTGSTPRPELHFGADGGTFGTAHGYASLAGAQGRFDYNIFGDQFATDGQGVNNAYSNSLRGANLGAALNERAGIRLRVRHSNAFTGVSNEWKFNGQPLIPPDSDQWARQNNLLGSAEITIAGPSRWQQRLVGFEYSHRRTNVNTVDDPRRVDAFGDDIDSPFHSITNINRAGLDYQADYQQRSWARTTLGYEFEDENGTVGSLPDALSHGVRRNHASFGQEALTLGRLSVVAGGRFVHNESFGSKGVPRVAVSALALRGGQIFSGTRLRFSYATGIKEPSFSESFGNGGGFPVVPNPSLKPEEARAFEAGLIQKFGSSYSLSATYFNNLFRNKIDFNFLGCNPICTGQYVNVNEALAHGAEVEVHGRPLTRLSVDAAYTFTSTQILKQPFAFDPLLEPGQPLLRRPKHSGTFLLTYLGNRWGGNVAGSFVGRRLDSDFLGYGIDHAAGYARIDLGGWCAINSRITAYANVENVLNKYYEEVVGYPALGANFRAGVRFRIGGE